MKRTVLVGILFTLFLIILTGYLYQIQTGRIIYAKNNNDNNFSLGEIYFHDIDNNTFPVALNKEFEIIYANPSKIKNKKETAKKVSSILKLDEKKVYKEFLNDKSLYFLLSERPSQEELKKIKKLKLAGIFTKKELFRYYPYENLASQTIGFVGFTKKKNHPVGLYGLEKFYSHELKSKDIFTTIDINLQTEIEQILEDNIKKFKAKGGTIIIQNPQTGEILALANKPDFNPNEYFKENISLFSNPAVEARYEPGSVMKSFTMAIGLQLKKFNQNTTFVDKGKITLNGRTITNWDKKAYGLIKVVEVLKHSINTGAVHLEEMIGDKDFSSFQKKFFPKTGIDLPGEIQSDFSSFQEKREIDYACASFGQGVAVTPIQLINGFSSLINGGNLMRPYLNREMKPKIIKKVLSPRVSKIIREMLVETVRGAKVAVIKGFRIGGKTGTALVPDLKKKTYSDKVIDSFTGFIGEPAKIAVLIKLDEPEGSPLSGRTVVPAFKKLAQFIISYYHLLPDEKNK